MKRKIQIRLHLEGVKAHLRGGLAFTMVELLVVIGVLAIAGTLILMIFTNSLKGSNKTQIVGVIKQNGQAVLETMDKSIRDADSVVCPSNNSSSDTLVLIKNGSYIRFKFIPPDNTNLGLGKCSDSIDGKVNGCILEDFPVQPAEGEKAQIKTFIAGVCTDPIGTDTVPASTYQTLTDTNLQTGVSIQDFTFAKNPNTGGFKDSITIKFKVAPGVQAPQSVAGQIDPVDFGTTVQLR